MGPSEEEEEVLMGGIAKDIEYTRCVGGKGNPGGRGV